MKPLDIINALQDTDPYVKMIFTEGGCYKFHCFLKTLFPSAELYIHKKKDHVATKIGRKYYDITGEVDKNEYDPIEITELEIVRNWSFAKNKMIQVGECPVCEEPIVI